MADIVVKGTAFSTDAVAGDVYFRTDLDLWCTYDGTRWLTAQIYQAAFAPQTLSADGYLTDYISIGTAYAPYVVRVAARSSVATTNNASNYWTVVFQSLATDLTATSLVSFATSADTADTATEHGTSTITIPNPANYSTFWLYGGKTLGSPGNITVVGTIYYHLIIT